MPALQNRSVGQALAVHQRDYVSGEPLQALDALRNGLAAAGVQRVVALGQAAMFETGISHDGFYPLQRFVRWVNDEG